jgi:hypothetical protein
MGCFVASFDSQPTDDALIHGATYTDSHFPAAAVAPKESFARANDSLAIAVFGSSLGSIVPNQISQKFEIASVLAQRPCADPPLP